MNRTDDRPPLTYKVMADAFCLAERLRREYPQGLRPRDLSHVMNMTIKDAVAEMKDNDFYPFDQRYNVADVACMVTRIRYDRRKDGIKKRV